MCRKLAFDAAWQDVLQKFMKSFEEAAGGEWSLIFGTRKGAPCTGSDKEFEKSMSTLMSCAPYINSCNSRETLYIRSRSMLSTELLTEPLQQIADKPQPRKLMSNSFSCLLHHRPVSMLLRLEPYLKEKKGTAGSAAVGR